ncbi:MAG TPA: hypothetical protein VEZ71_03395 [Archangium sp.]|nr:hypothetical protein [Archangium sp.]
MRTLPYTKILRELTELHALNMADRRVMNFLILEQIGLDPSPFTGRQPDPLVADKVATLSARWREIARAVEQREKIISEVLVALPHMGEA